MRKQAFTPGLPLHPGLLLHPRSALLHFRSARYIPGLPYILGLPPTFQVSSLHPRSSPYIPGLLPIPQIYLLHFRYPLYILGLPPTLQVSPIHPWSAPYTPGSSPKPQVCDAVGLAFWLLQKSLSGLQRGVTTVQTPPILPQLSFLRVKVKQKEGKLKSSSRPRARPCVL